MGTIQDTVVMVTGADGGLGRALLASFLARGAKKVYAAGIKLPALEKLADEHPAICAVELDISSRASVANCIAGCSDLTILVNNAGVEKRTAFSAEDAYASALIEMQVNFLGTLQLCQGFSGILMRNKPAMLVNILSLASLVCVPSLGTYCASKAAAHMMTAGFRDEFSQKGISVHGVYPGYINTAMTEGMDVDKSSPVSVADAIVEDLIKGTESIFPDPLAQKLSGKLNPVIPVFQR